MILIATRPIFSIYFLQTTQDQEIQNTAWSARRQEAEELQLLSWLQCAKSYLNTVT